MYTMQDVGLCCGSLAGADFRTLVEAAAAAGFGTISLWPSHFQDALAAGLSEGEMRRVLEDNGLVISELDPFCAWLPIEVAPDDIAAHFFAYDEFDFFRVADALGARSLNVIQAGGEALPRSQVVEALASLCERARAHGLVVSVEFLPWSPIANLGQALELVAATGQADCGVNIDTWHHFRSGGTVEALARLEPGRVAAVQLNDVAAEAWDDVLQETAQGRLLPGRGASDTRAVLQALWEAGIRVPLNVEVFSSELQQLSPRQAAFEIAESMHALLEPIAAQR
jgi:sugar phosphate isomerase/epimerase